MFPPVADVTAQEYDLQFGTNVLGTHPHHAPVVFRSRCNYTRVGHYYFTSLLIPALLKGAASSPDGKARVVTTSSAASYLAYTINFNTLKDGPVREKQLSGWLYNQSKLVRFLPLFS
jgi:NAD(P)-dependent dehydrogenase (short-subunit alcohol dehydrogenase family)